MRPAKPFSPKASLQRQGNVYSCKKSSAELFTAQELIGAEPLNGHFGDRSPSWFYPNLYYLGHPMSQVDTR
jgi:hypothetical protein